MSKVKVKRISYDNEQLEGYINPINALLRVLSQDKPVPYQTELADLSMTIDSYDFELYVIEENERIVEMGSIHFHRTLTKTAAYIEDVAALDEYQGRGYGYMIVSQLSY